MTTIKVSVVYATPEKQTVVELDVGAGTTAGTLLDELSSNPVFARLDLEHMPIGVFGALVERSRILEPGDRVELLRPLTVDPKAERRRRARET